MFATDEGMRYFCAMQVPDENQDGVNEGIRINKYLTQVGYCSRREADKLIDQGVVKINGKVPEKGTKVQEGDSVAVRGKEIVRKLDQEHVYIALNKPVGIVCTTDQRREKDNIIDFVNYPSRIFPVGRLDKMSEGLIILTNDGEIVNHILRERNGHEKEYLVTVNRPIDDAFVQAMSSGVRILDTMTRPCVVEKLSDNSFRIVLVQGLNRQIRRMCEALGHRVIRLKRIRIMQLHLDTPPGKWRHLSQEEVRELHSES